MILKEKIFSLYLLILLVLPSLAQVGFGLSSFAVGLSISLFLAVVVFFPYFKKIYLVRSGSSLVFISVLYLLFVYIVTSLFFIPDGVFEKNLLSTLLFFIQCLCCFLFATVLKGIDKGYVLGLVNLLCCFFLVIGLISLFYQPALFGFSEYHKSVFPFSEPSHYITTVGFLFAYSFFFGSNNISKVILILFLGCFSIAQPSMLGVILMIMIFIIYSAALSFFVNSLVLTLLVISTFFGYLYGYIDGDYFSSRLTFSIDTTNSTALVFLQGWENSFNVLKSSFFGLGFQNALFVVSGDFGERAFDVSGRYINKEGAFLASKLIVEFGYFGLLMVLFYVSIFLKEVLFLRRVVANKIRLEKHDNVYLLCSVIVVFFFLEMFVRGYGYYTPNVFLFISSLIFLKTLHFGRLHN